MPSGDPVNSPSRRRMKEVEANFDSCRPLALLQSAIPMFISKWKVGQLIVGISHADEAGCYTTLTSLFIDLWHYIPPKKARGGIAVVVVVVVDESSFA